MKSQDDSIVVWFGDCVETTESIECYVEHVGYYDQESIDKGLPNNELFRYSDWMVPSVATKHLIRMNVIE